MPVRISCGECNKSFDEFDFDTHKCKVVNGRYKLGGNGPTIIVAFAKLESEQKIIHQWRVRNWRPPCHCMQYCRPWSVRTDSVGDPVITPTGITIKLPSQGITRPTYTGNGGPHPGYKFKKDNLRTRFKKRAITIFNLFAQGSCLGA